jgi:hypothetical protein
LVEHKAPPDCSGGAFFGLVYVLAEVGVKILTQATGFIALGTVYIRPTDNASHADQNRVLLKKTCTQSCTQERLACAKAAFFAARRRIRCLSMKHRMYRASFGLSYWTAGDLQLSLVICAWKNIAVSFFAIHKRRLR